MVKKRPGAVCAQNPSILLSVLVLVLKPVFGYRVLIDAHNSGIFPLEGRSGILMAVAKFCQKAADLTLVTNDGLKQVVEDNKGTAYVLPDKIPDMPSVNADTLQSDGRFPVAFICSFSDDEPWEEVFEASSMLADQICLYVTGKYKDHVDLSQVPENVKLLGYIPEQAYWDLLASVGIIIDLTTREDCLVCGAYEAVAAHKPMVLSYKRIIMAYFSKGCVYVKPEKTDIVNGIRTAIEQYPELEGQIVELEEDLNGQWSELLHGLENKIQTLLTG